MQDQIIDFFKDTEEGLLDILGLDKDTVKNGPGLDDEVKVEVKKCFKKLPRKLKKELKKHFGPKAYIVWKKSNSDYKMPKRYVNMKSKMFREIGL